MLTEATRGENVPELWEKIEAHRAYLEESGQLEERRARNLAGEVFSVASARAKQHLEHAVADDPELRRLLDEVQRRELDPLSAVREILEKVFHIGDDERQHPDFLTSRRRARASTASRASRRCTARRRCRGSSGREVHLKAENLQRTGSFKIRGAYNRISTLSPEERAAGVVAASAGNHGQAVAWAAREVGAQRAHLHAAGRADGEGRRDAALRRRGRADRAARSRTASTRRRAYVDASTARRSCIRSRIRVVIAGQGTIGLELAEQVRRRRDGRSSRSAAAGSRPGIALALRAVKPGLRIVGVQAAGTLPGGSGFTIADGIAVKKPGELTMSILDDVLDDIVSVTDEEISEAIVAAARAHEARRRGRAAPSASPRSSPARSAATGCVVPVLSGGNIDATLLISVMRHGLAVAGRYLVVRTRVPDRPGELAKLLTLLANERVNVVEVEHQRETADLPVAETGVELTLAHARRRALRRDPRDDGAARLSGRAAELARRDLALDSDTCRFAPSARRRTPTVARFCLACGARARAAEARREERKVVTVLFADLVGFTSRAEQLDPEDVRAVLAPYWERLRAELERSAAPSRSSSATR